MRCTLEKLETTKRKPIVYGVIRGLLCAASLRPLPSKHPYGSYWAIDRLGRKELRIPVREKIDWLS